MARTLANLTLLIGLTSASVAAFASVPAPAAAPNTPAAPGPTAQLRRIVAGPVVRNARGISGSFHVASTSAGGGNAGVVSDGTGGACLLFSARREGGATCRDDGDCRSQAALSGGAGYCVAASDAARGRCWIRPAETAGTPYCLRSPHHPLPMGTEVAFPSDDQGRTRPISNPARGWWRVHACLNRLPMGCASPERDNRQTDDGTPFHVR